MKRRKFIKTTSLLGASAAIGMSGMPVRLSASLFKGDPDITVVEGKDLFKNTIKAIDGLGGMSSFIGHGDVVGLLLNADFETRGAFLHPEIALAVIDQCYIAGAKEVIIFQHLPEDYWQRTPLSAGYNDMIDSLGHVSSNKFPAKYNIAEWTVMDKVEGAVHISEIQIIRAVFECDAFINMPIAKHHNGTFFTGTMKNMMGLLTRESNVQFHLGSGHRNDPDYLGQSIADLNLVRKPDLVVMDASEFLVTNGPSGPGETKRLDYVLAGTDPVAMDTLGAEFVGYEPQEVIMINRGHEMGIGEMDKSKLNIQWMKG